jgi:hypothetical protein
MSKRNRPGHKLVDFTEDYTENYKFHRNTMIDSYEDSESDISIPSSFEPVTPPYSHYIPNNVQPVHHTVEVLPERRRTNVVYRTIAREHPYEWVIVTIGLLIGVILSIILFILSK